VVNDFPSVLAPLYPLRPLAGGEPRIVAGWDPVRQCSEQCFPAGVSLLVDTRTDFASSP
jgi:hypothetical protein